jgi:hypothetical protein
MKKNYTILFTGLLFGGCFSSAIAQSVQKIGNNSTSINSNAVLDLESTNKGLLVPRLALTGTTAAAPLATAVAGMVVYNTASIADVTPGFYYNDGTNWIKAADASSALAMATPSVYGQIKLGGDLAGTGSTASAPIITNNAITDAKLADNAVITTKINDAAVTPSKIEKGSSNQVLKTNTAGNAVEWGVLSPDNLAGKDLTNGGDDSIIIADGSGATLKATTIKVADSGITNIKLADDAVENSKIKDNAVTPSKIEKGSSNQVLKTNTAGDAVEWGVLSPENLAGKDFTADDTSLTITGGAGASLKLSSIKVTDAGITDAKLATDAVITNKIKNLAVTDAKLADNAVITTKINDAAVTPSKIESGGNNKVLMTSDTGVVEWTDSSTFDVIVDGKTITGAGSTTDPFKLSSSIVSSAISITASVDTDGTIICDVPASGMTVTIPAASAANKVEF